MTQCNTLNVKQSNPQVNKLKSQIKNGAEVNLKLSLNLVGASNDGNNFPHKLLLINTQVSKIRKAFANNLYANVNLLKTQLHKKGQSSGFLGRFLRPLLKTELSLIENVPKTFAKTVLIP